MMAGLAACDQQAPPAPPPTAPAKAEWTADEIAADPEGYMTWADGRIQEQIDDRQRRLASLSDRLIEVERRQTTFNQRLTAVRNVHDRFETAIRRARDEDRWPMRIGGQSFDESRALAILSQAKQYLEDHGPLAEAYASALARLRQAHGQLQRDVEQLRRLREKLALDLERVRLNQGLEELSQLRRTEQELAGFTAAVGQMADDAAMLHQLPPEDRPGRHVDLEQLIQ